MDIGTEFKRKAVNILVLTYWSYSDALIQTYTLPYVEMIRKVIPRESRLFLVTLENDSSISSNGGNREKTFEWLPFRYHRFGWKAFFSWGLALTRLMILIFRAKVKYIHCWGTPAGAIGYLLCTVTGRKLVLDSFEPHAEAMVENGTWTRESVAFRLLFYLEKKQAQKGEYVIAATQAMRHYAAQKYGVQIKNFYSKPAGVDLDLFSLSKVKKREVMASLNFSFDDIICVYAGKFGGIYLDQEVFDFLAVAAAFWRERFKVLLLTSASREEIDAYCRKSSFDSRKITVRFVRHGDVPLFLGVGDFAITPVKPVPTKRYCTPIKDGEYWALGMPVVIPANISEDSDIIEQHDIGAVLHSFDTVAYGKAVRKINDLLQTPRRLVIRKVASDFRSFSQAERIYEGIYSSI